MDRYKGIKPSVFVRACMAASVLSSVLSLGAASAKEKIIVPKLVTARFQYEGTQDGPMIFSDPVEVIMDHAQSTNTFLDRGHLKELQKTDPGRLQAWASAVFRDRKGFFYKGELYQTGADYLVDGKTQDGAPGQKIDGLPFIASSFTGQTEESLRGMISTFQHADSVPYFKAEFKQRWAEAILSGRKSFHVDKTRVFELTEDPATKKLVVPVERVPDKVVSGAGYTDDPQYKALRAEAVLNGESTFWYKHRLHDTETGQAGTGAAIYDAYSKHQGTWSSMQGDDAIQTFYKTLNTGHECGGYYLIADKKSGVLSLNSYTDGRIKTFPIITGKLHSDARTVFTVYDNSGDAIDDRQSNNSTGFGSYTLSVLNDSEAKSSYFNEMYGGKLLHASRGAIGAPGVLALHAVPRPSRFSNRTDVLSNSSSSPSDKRLSGGCINMLPADFDALTSILGKVSHEGKISSCPLHVLPETPYFGFQIQNGKLEAVFKGDVDRVTPAQLKEMGHTERGLKEFLCPENPDGCVIWENYKDGSKTLQRLKIPYVKKLLNGRYNLSQNLGGAASAASSEIGKITAPAVQQMVPGFGDTNPVEHFGNILFPQIGWMKAAVANKNVREYLDALTSEGPKLQKALGIPRDRYMTLVRLAFGAMWNETQDGTSWKYPIKEGLQPLVSILKKLREANSKVTATTNSRGLTQTKYIPKEVLKLYPGVDKDKLTDPKMAAVVTLVNLNGMYEQLMGSQRPINNRRNEDYAKRHQKELKEKGYLDYPCIQITDENWPQLVAYYYIGSRKQVQNCSSNPDDRAQPDRNAAVRNMMSAGNQVVFQAAPATARPAATAGPASDSREAE